MPARQILQRGSCRFAICEVDTREFAGEGAFLTRKVDDLVDGSRETLGDRQPDTLGRARDQEGATFLRFLYNSTR